MMVYRHKWSPVSCRSSAGQGKFTDHRLTFYHCATQPTMHSDVPLWCNSRWILAIKFLAVVAVVLVEAVVINTSTAFLLLPKCHIKVSLCSQVIGSVTETVFKNLIAKIQLLLHHNGTADPFFIRKTKTFSPTTYHWTNYYQYTWTTCSTQKTHWWHWYTSLSLRYRYADNKNNTKLTSLFMKCLLPFKHNLLLLRVSSSPSSNTAAQSIQRTSTATSKCIFIY